MAVEHSARCDGVHRCLALGPIARKPQRQPMYPRLGDAVSREVLERHAVVNLMVRAVQRIHRRHIDQGGGVFADDVAVHLPRDHERARQVGAQRALPIRDGGIGEIRKGFTGPHQHLAGDRRVVQHHVGFPAVGLDAFENLLDRRFITDVEIVETKILVARVRFLQGFGPVARQIG